MNSRSPRALTALLLALSLWTSAITAVAAQQPQTQEQQQQSQEKSAKEQKDQKATAQKTPTKNAGKPLSKNEDPNMIGKRNINSGIIS